MQNHTPAYVCVCVCVCVCVGVYGHNMHRGRGDNIKDKKYMCLREHFHTPCGAT